MSNTCGLSDGVFPALGPDEIEARVTELCGADRSAHTYFRAAIEQKRAVTELVSHSILSDVQLARLVARRPFYLEEAELELVCRNPGFGEIAMAELSKAYTCLDRSYDQVDEFAATLGDLPLASCGVLLSRHWWFTNDFADLLGADEARVPYIGIVTGTVELGQAGIDLVHTLCCDAEARAECVPRDNHHVWESFEVARALLPVPVAV
jgi:hypothetical protein